MSFMTSKGEDCKNGGRKPLILITIIEAPSPKLEPLKLFDKIHDKGLITL